MKEKLTYNEKELIREALIYYRDSATQVGEECCGLVGTKRKIINRAIDKIEKYS